MRLPCALLAVAVGLSACGGGGASGTAQEWLEAVADGDVDAACDVMAPSGTRAVAAKYTDLGERASCRAAMGEYVREFDDRKADVLLDGGLEEEPPLDNGRVGVFPAVKKHETEVILMEEIEGDWKVISIAVPPSGAASDPPSGR